MELDVGGFFAISNDDLFSFGVVVLETVIN
jgi:hypothetical protein